MTHFEGGDQWNFGDISKKKIEICSNNFKKKFSKGVNSTYNSENRELKLRFTKKELDTIRFKPH